MAVVDVTVALDRDTVRRIQAELGRLGLDAWLLYDFRGLNPVAGSLLGLPAMTRRYFVLVPRAGAPIAVTHRIEQQPWTGWIGENRPYLSWRELEAAVAALVRGRGRVAMEYEPGDAVPYVDRVPAGVLEMVRAAGAEVVTSSELVSAFTARWSAEGLAGHRRAAHVLQEVARDAFSRIGERLRSGASTDEWEIRQWVAAELVARGLAVGGDAIVAVNGNAANPHYGPSAADHAPIAPGDVVLIDLWGKETEESIYADQTWMAYVGSRPPPRVAELWAAVRDARNAAVELVERRWAGGEPVFGYEVDDAARGLIQARGYGERFIHRTGHSIDRDLHGSGPNIDNLETRDTRRLIPGIGFSIEPGIYLPGELGFRTEIDVFMGHNGPEVTTPSPQDELWLIDAGPEPR
jgi:Xaa-Pro aminopeptidase